MEYFLSGKLISHAKPILLLYQIARIFLLSVDISIIEFFQFGKALYWLKAQQSYNEVYFCNTIVMCIHTIYNNLCYLKQLSNKKDKCYFFKQTFNRHTRSCYKDLALKVMNHLKRNRMS